MKYKSFNPSNLKDHFSGDEEILIDMITGLQESIQDLLESMRRSIHEEDATQLKINAHTFKGIMGNFFAEEGVRLSRELEKNGESMEFSKAMSVLNDLENLLTLFLFELPLFKKDLDKTL